MTNDAVIERLAAINEKINVLIAKVSLKGDHALTTEAVMVGADIDDLINDLLDEVPPDMLPAEEN